MGWPPALLTPRQQRRLASNEGLEAIGTWQAHRHTVCIICERRTVTDTDRWCRRCADRVA
jgi:hypothetical protein